MDGVGVVVVGGKRGSFCERAEGQSHTRSCGRGRRARTRRCTRRHGAVCSALREPRKVDCFVYFLETVRVDSFAVVFVVDVVVKKEERSAFTGEAFTAQLRDREGFYSGNMHRRVPTFLRRSSVQLNVTFKIFFFPVVSMCFVSFFFFHNVTGFPPCGVEAGFCYLHL